MYMKLQLSNTELWDMDNKCAIIVLPNPWLITSSSCVPSRLARMILSNTVSVQYTLPANDTIFYFKNNTQNVENTPCQFRIELEN